MRIRLIVAAFALFAMTATVQAQEPRGFYGAFGIDLFFFGDGDALDAAGIENPFIGLNPKLGYRLSNMIGLNAGYEYYLPKSTDGGDWMQSTIQLTANVFPFGDGGLHSLYFIGGLDLVTVEFEYDTLFGTFTSSDSETGINLGLGFMHPLSRNFSFTAEGTYSTGDYGGMELELGGRLYFGR